MIFDYIVLSYFLMVFPIIFMMFVDDRQPYSKCIKITYLFSMIVMITGIIMFWYNVILYISSKTVRYLLTVY